MKLALFLQGAFALLLTARPSSAFPTAPSPAPDSPEALESAIAPEVATASETASTTEAPEPATSPSNVLPLPNSPVDADAAVDTTIEQLLTPLPRLVIYYQTTHDANDLPISMLPLITEKNIALTHLIVCSLHVNPNGVVHLNDYPPEHPRFYTLWNETLLMKQAGVKVIGMVGGAAPGSFSTQTLDSTNPMTFEAYYAQLRDAIVNFGLEGMDLDVEQDMSQAGITRLVRRLRVDFGPGFIITLAPVASALRNGANLSGFSYKTLETAVGDDIQFYNAQFYNGFGSMATPAEYERVIKQGWDPRKILAGQITTPEGGGQWVPYDKFNATIVALRKEYGQIGGVMGWEYFNSEPGGLSEPWEWAQVMTAILRPNEVPPLKVTKKAADTLVIAWKDSVEEGSLVFAGAGGSGQGKKVMPEMNVDYYAMVNV